VDHIVATVTSGHTVESDLGYHCCVFPFLIKGISSSLLCVCSLKCNQKMMAFWDIAPCSLFEVE
jgi:hypothetical protein